MIQFTLPVPVRCLLSVLLSSFFLLTSGCQAANQDAETRRGQVPTIALTGDDSGKTVKMRPGDTITICLDEKPATGYRWAVEKYNEDVVVLEATDYVRPDGAALGGGGQRILTFEAKASGKVTLHLKLWRAWAGDSSIVERFAVTLDVQT